MYKFKKIIILICGISCYLVALFVSIENIAINLIDYKNKDIHQGIIHEVYFSPFNDGPGGNWNYFVKKDNLIYHGEYNNRENFRIKIGDSIAYKRRDFRNHIIALKVNGKIIRNYYGIWEVITLITFIVLTLGVFSYIKMVRKKQIHRKTELITKKFDYGDLMDNL